MTTATADTRKLHAPTAFGRAMFSDALDPCAPTVPWERPEASRASSQALVRRARRGVGLFVVCVVSLAGGAALGWITDRALAPSEAARLANAPRTAFVAPTPLAAGAALAKVERHPPKRRRRHETSAASSAPTGIADLELSFRVAP